MKKVMGRLSIFEGKVNDRDHRVQAFLTEIGRARFENARLHLQQLARTILGRAPEVVSDADTIEYLSRGEAATIGYLKTKARGAKQ